MIVKEAMLSWEDSEVRLSRFKSNFYDLIMVWPWMNNLTSVSLIFLISKDRINDNIDSNHLPGLCEA